MSEMSAFAAKHYNAAKEFKRAIDEAETQYVNAVNTALAVLRKAVGD